LGVAWYGGEPLLYAEDLISLSNTFKELAKKHNIGYESKLISNCYFLSDTLENKLFSAGVRELQVSYDGSRSVHDSVRYHKGNPSFDVITENIYRCLEKWKVIVRVNVSKKNICDIPLLIQQLSEKDINKGAIIYFAPIHANRSICRDAADPVLNDLVLNDEFNTKCLEFKNMALELGFKVRLPLSSTDFCSAVATSGVVVEPNGQVKKCYLDVGNDLESFGFLDDNGINITNTTNLDKWNTYNPFVDSSCLECMALPLCYGGCPWEAMRMIPRIERCHPLKNNLQEHIEFILKNIEKGALYDQVNATLQIPITGD
jgi:uncharacterized protein